MQEAMRYGAHIPTALNAANSVRLLRQVAAGPTPATVREEVRKMVAESAVVVVARKGCCMSHVAKRLLQGLGANPGVYEVEEGCEDGVVAELRGGGGVGGRDGAVQLPVVFVGGRWLGGLDRIMASHITGELTPLLKQAGALWL